MFRNFKRSGVWIIRGLQVAHQRYFPATLEGTPSDYNHETAWIHCEIPPPVRKFRRTSVFRVRGELGCKLSARDFSQWFVGKVSGKRGKKNLVLGYSFAKRRAQFLGRLIRQGPANKRKVGRLPATSSFRVFAMICFLTNFLEIFIVHSFLFSFILFCKEILSILLTIFIIFIRSIFKNSRYLSG